MDFQAQEERKRVIPLCLWSIWGLSGLDDARRIVEGGFSFLRLLIQVLIFFSSGNRLTDITRSNFF